MSLSVFDLLAPHYCCSCGEIGGVLCEYCKYDIVSERFGRCIVCLGPVGGAEALCRRCRPAYKRVWCVGERDGSLERLINDYKFERSRAIYRTLGQLLDETISVLPNGVTVVPVPTIKPHIRQRGYGHTEMVAREFAKRRGLCYYPVLGRRTATTQHGSSRSVRLKQAKVAFEAKPISPGVYLLIDDVFTTGATLEYASRALLSAGATEVWAAVISRQPVEKDALI